MHMNYEPFIQISEMVAPLIQKEDTNMRKSVSPKERLAWTLRCLATGESFLVTEYQFRISSKVI